MDLNGSHLLLLLPNRHLSVNHGLLDLLKPIKIGSKTTQRLVILSISCLLLLLLSSLLNDSLLLFNSLLLLLSQ